ncbi:hypothetical protein N7517_010827 [Penicillium concentricum]|uniref:DDE-1 domain-containing protein n=1 Tax=Penicillium concentricum TaxID=293559 RepID=A0A9W9REU3_9EURO|nr:uncharacterized protein N7517_010827 [Penicillium concentricum]KAJ5356218.1 hypothetical protein N7517_010827 [Penicillium concentricum]
MSQISQLITTSVTQILNRDGNDATISKAWVDRFIKRLPDDLKPPKTRSTKKKTVSTENIYNFDDTIFQIGQGKKPRMVVTRGADPFVVIQGDHYFDEWLTYEGTPDEAVFMMNSSGQVDELAACEWLESFHRQTEDRAADGQPKLVLFRSQPQYLSFKFLNFCEQHKILPFSFPPNIGHLIQPFDGKPFQCYKQYWRSQGILFCMIDDPDDEKTVFLMDFPSIRETSFKPEVITKAFADRGIVPFDPYKVKQPL